MERKWVKLISTLIAVLISAILLLSCVFVFALFKNKYEKPKAADLTISTPLEFKTFMNSSDTYAGKTVVLNHNINCSSLGSLSKKEFNGTFDGCGYTIYNITLGTTNSFTALFSKITNTSTITNLKISNVKVGKNAGYVGLLVGYSNQGSINCCMIKNAEVEANNYIAGIFAVGQAYVTNCIIQDVSFKYPYSSYVSGQVVLVGPAVCPYETEMRGGNNVWFKYLGLTYANSGNPSTIKTCTFRNVLNNNSPLDISKDVSLDKYVTNVNTLGSPDQYANYGHIIQDCYSSKEGGFVNLNKNNIGGAYDASSNEGLSTYWYYPATDSYNDGWPMLRMFITWKTMEVYSWQGGSVDPASFKIPKEYDQEIYTDLSTVSETVVVCGRTLTVTVDSGYEFDSWEYSSTYVITAKFKSIIYSITFKHLLNLISDEDYFVRYEWGTKDGIVNSRIETEDVEDKVQYNTEITCSVIYDQYNTYIIYQWENHGFSYYLRRIKYIIPKIYTINSKSMFTDGKTYTVTSDTAIQTSIQLKSYTTQFK